MLVRPHVSFVISPPAAQLFWSSPVARQRYLARRRTRALRQRKKAASKTNNLRRCYRVWMADLDVIALLDDVKLAQQRDDQFTPRELREAVDREWIDVAGRVIAEAALSAIKKARK